MSKITYTNKVQNQVNPLPLEKQFTASDANEIKKSVNALYDDVANMSLDLKIDTTSVTNGTGTNLLYDDNGILSEVPGLSYDKTNDTFSYLNNNAGFIFGQMEVSPGMFVDYKGIFDNDNFYYNALLDSTPLGGKLQSIIGFNNQVDIDTVINIRPDGHININADKNVGIYAIENVNINADNYVNIYANNYVIINANNYVNINADNYVTISAFNNVSINALSDVSINSANIELKSDFITLNIENQSYDPLGQSISNAATLSDVIAGLKSMGIFRDE
jgi:hypothetical protein